MGVTKGTGNLRHSVKHPTNVHDRNRDSTELEYAIGTGYTIPRVSEIPEYGVDRISGAEAIGVPEDGPLD